VGLKAKLHYEREDQGKRRSKIKYLVCRESRQLLRIKQGETKGRNTAFIDTNEKCNVVWEARSLHFNVGEK